MKILVVRNDKIGDFMLAWPTFALIKRNWPEAEIIALVPPYTSQLAELCPWIDNIIIAQPSVGVRALYRILRNENCGAMLTLFSTMRVALAGWLARIPYRLAPATKAAQYFYTHRMVQRRSRSQKPEYAYNLDLAYRLLADLKGEQPQQTSEHDGDFLPKEIVRPLLSIPPDKLANRASFCKHHQLSAERPLVFIHPGSGGSANNLSISQYAELANRLSEHTPLNFVISAGPQEQMIALELSKQIKATHCILDSSGGLASLIVYLHLADLFISGSTGPMHIAGALDRPTATFFPRHRSATPLRWQPLNAPAKRLTITPPLKASADDVSAIDIASAADAIIHKFFT